MRFFLRASFLSGLLLGVLLGDACAQNRFNTVVIDAGHGGFDRGGIPQQRASEKDATLEVALRLRILLKAAGYRVVMTRTGDYFVTLGQRVAIANSQPNAIFVSIHFNSAPRTSADGIETYFYSSESAPLASSIQSSVLRVAGTENRGVRRRGYFVLRRTAIPAVLVECGFLTNYYEAQRSSTSAYRQKLAGAIAAGIMQRPTIGSRTNSTNRSSRVDVGLQPFLDQRFMRNETHSARRSTKAPKKKSRKASASRKKKPQKDADE